MSKITKKAPRWSWAKNQIMAQPKRTFVPIVVCSIGIIIGLGGIAVGIAQAFRSIQAAYWPVANGTILNAQTRSYSAKSRQVYYPEVSYRYQVAGGTYIGKQICFGRAPEGSSDLIQIILDGYPVGKTVSVHYSPGDPQVAVLEVGIHGGVWTNLLVGALFTVGGSGILIIVRKGKYTNAHPPIFLPR